MNIEEYERLRYHERRTNYEMVIPRAIRYSMLRKEWNVTQNQIANSIRNVIRIKNQRRATINKLGAGEKEIALDIWTYINNPRQPNRDSLRESFLYVLLNFVNHQDD